MKMKVVSLVLVCLGVISGFVLPLSRLDIDLISNANVGDEKSKVNITTLEPGHTKELTVNRSEIDENALYEHAAVKQNNQSERAFIYINQKYKKPSLHHYFRLAQNGPEFSRSFHMPPPLPQAFIQRRNEPCKSVKEQFSSYHSGYNPPYRSPDVASYFLNPTLLHGCDYKDVPNTVTDIGISYSGNKILNQFNEQYPVRRDFIELLKPPLLRPSNRGNKIKVKYDGISGSRYTPPCFKDYFKQASSRHQHNPKANILVDERKNDMGKRYGFSSYRQPAFRSNGIIQGVEEPNFGGESMIHVDPSRYREKPQYEDKLLDQYLRDALGEQVTSDEKEIVRNDCSYRDCVLQHTKPSSSITHHKDINKPDCNCGQRLRLTKKDLFISKDGLDRGDQSFHLKQNTLIQPSSDVTYFKEMLTQNLNNRNDGIAVKTIIKLNSTLYH